VTLDGLALNLRFHIHAVLEYAPKRRQTAEERHNSNKGDGKTGASYCADGVVILDDFAPHIWQGPGACASWYKEYEAFAAKGQITAASVALGKARHLDVDSDYAYLVMPVTLTYTKADKPISDKAIVTMSLKKGSSGWQITGWAWADQ
jgi:hypothetical protein